LLAATALVSTALAAQAVAADRPTRALVIEPDVETRSRIVEVMVHVPVAGKPAAEVSEQALQAAIDAALALAAEQVPSVPAKDLVIQATEYHEHPVSNGKLPATLTAEVKFPAKPPAQSPQQIVIDQTSGEVVSGSLFTPVSAQAEAPLEVRVWTQSKEFADGDEMIIRIRGNKDFYGRLIYRDVGGNVVQILPNAYRADAMFKADTDYVVPGPGDKFRLRVSAPFGAESVVLMASTKPLGDISTKQAGNGMLVAEAGMDQVSSRTRALKLEPVEVAAATPLAAKAAAGADFIERTWTVTTKAK
jgi:hypothetical protein